MADTGMTNGSEAPIAIVAPAITTTTIAAEQLVGLVGSLDTQTGPVQHYPLVYKSTAAGPNVMQTITIGSGHMIGIDLAWTARETGAIGSSASGRVYGSCYNNAGTVTCYGPQAYVSAQGATFCGGTTTPAITFVTGSNTVSIDETCSGISAATDYMGEVTIVVN